MGVKLKYLLLLKKKHEHFKYVLKQLLTQIDWEWLEEDITQI